MTSTEDAEDQHCKRAVSSETDREVWKEGRRVEMRMVMKRMMMTNDWRGLYEVQRVFDGANQ